MEKGVPIRSISRSLSVLREINQQGALSMMAISRRGGLPYATACRIVQTLIHEGVLEQEPVRKLYRPTALVQSLAHGFQSEDHLVAAGAGPIRALTHEIGWPVSLTMRVGNHVMVRDSTHAETSLTFEHYHPGFTLPLLECAAGLICLSRMSAEQLENFTRWLSLSDGDNRSGILLRELPYRLEKIREDGYASYGRGQHNRTPGRTSSMAVPILRDGRFEGALTIIYFTVAMTQAEAAERYLAQLQASAARIGAASGGPAMAARNGGQSS